MSSSIKLKVLCTGCLRHKKYGMFKKEKDDSCPGCGGEDWSISGTMISTFGGSAGQNLAINATGAALLATTGVGFYRKSQTETSERDFDFSGLENSKVLEILGANTERKIELILEIVAERNAKYVAEMDALIDSDGAHCFMCKKGFLPGIILAKEGLLQEGVFTHNSFCSGRCLRIYKEKFPKNRCKACRKGFNKPEKPDDPVLARRWKERPFFAAGYCSNQCHKTADRKRCKSCGKAFEVSKVDYLPKHKKIKEVQERGFCSLKCDAAGESYSEDEEEFEDESNLMSAECDQGHVFEVPDDHGDYMAICPECQARVEILEDL